MRFRGAIQRTTSTNAQSTGCKTESRRLEQIARFVILGLGFVIVADAAIRRLESLGPTAAVDNARKHRGGSVPHDQTRIGTDETDASSGSNADDQPIDDDETNVDLADGERSAEAIDERVESEIQDEPATPGEMSIDEDVADELQDDDEE